MWLVKFIRNCFDVGLVSNKGFKFVFVSDCVSKFGSQRTTVNMFETWVHFSFLAVSCEHAKM